MNITSDNAYLLHSRPYRENSFLVDWFSQSQGIFRGVFRGGKKSRPLTPFRESEVSWGGQGGLKTIRSVEPVRPGSLLQGNRLFSAMYVNELLVRLLHHHDEHQYLYQAYCGLLDNLARADTCLESLLRQFEFLLLEELGYGYQFDVVAESGEAVMADRLYCFEPEQGLLPMTKQVLSGQIAGQHVLAIAVNDYTSPEARRVAKHITRLALGRLLGDKPLKSRELFRPRAGTIK